MPPTTRRRKKSQQTPRDLARGMATSVSELQEALEAARRLADSTSEFAASDSVAVAQAWVYLRFCLEWRRQRSHAVSDRGCVTAGQSAWEWLTGLSAGSRVTAGPARPPADRFVGEDGRLSFGAIDRLRESHRRESHRRESNGALAAGCGIIEEIERRLASCDLPAIFANSCAEMSDEALSPEASFFEPFLAACDSAERTRHALFLTPQPLAAFMLRGVDAELRDEWGLPLGIASDVAFSELFAESEREIDDPNGSPRSFLGVSAFGTKRTPLKILDPAAGTGIFLTETVRRIRDVLVNAWRGESEMQRSVFWKQYARESLLDRLQGCELLPAAHAVCQYLLAATLAESGASLRAIDRLRIERRNALELADDSRNDACGDYTVVVGNPPYSRVSQDRSGIGPQLIAPYQALVKDEPNQQPLADDYVKFMALADAVTRSSSRAVVALVTNHNWLSGILFRGLRQTLLEHWDRFRIVDLHGHRGEVAPADDANGNVFGIGQGVAVSIRSRDRDTKLADNVDSQRSEDAANSDADILPLWRSLQAKPATDAGRNRVAAEGSVFKGEVFRADLWGQADEKLRRLATAEIGGMAWQRVQPAAPLWHFHASPATSTAYRQWPALDECFLDYSSGLMTVRDRLAIARSQAELAERIDRFRDPAVPDAHFVEAFGVKEYRNWSLAAARRGMRDDDAWRSRLTRIAYRPFDERWLFYSADLVSYPNWRIMTPLMEPGNLALVASRLVRNEPPAHAFVANCPVEIIFLSPKSSNNAFVFPLFMPAGKSSGRESNVRTAVCGDDGRRWFARAYAVLSSQWYRTKFAEELRYGFARIPPLSDRSLDDRLAAMGERLIAVQLGATTRESTGEERTAFANDEVESRVMFVGEGDAVVSAGMPRYDAARQAIVINREQAFVGVPREVWDFRVGGYTVCRSWFTAGRRTGTSRVGTRLSAEDVEQFRRVVAAIAESLKSMREIDAIIHEAGWVRT